MLVSIDVQVCKIPSGMEMTGTMPELSADMDQESQEMRAIDPNMTTGLSDSMMGEDSQV